MAKRKVERSDRRRRGAREATRRPRPLTVNRRWVRRYGAKYIRLVCRLAAYVGPWRALEIAFGIDERIGSLQCPEAYGGGAQPRVALHSHGQQGAAEAMFALVAMTTPGLAQWAAARGRREAGQFMRELSS